jgi:hypoxanthine phosphoribosyltransferase
MLNEIRHIASSADLLYSATEVEAAIDVMAEAINLAMAQSNPLLLCVMNGGIVLCGKLMTRLNFPLTLDAINASRYRNQTQGGEIDWIQKPRTALKDRTILLVDDILDEGLTLQALYDYCHEQGASSIYSAVLVNKNLGHPKPIQADFVGLETENRYIFGYGMDYKGYHRNAAGIYACKELL